MSARGRAEVNRSEANSIQRDPRRTGQRPFAKNENRHVIEPFPIFPVTGRLFSRTESAGTVPDSKERNKVKACAASEAWCASWPTKGPPDRIPTRSMVPRGRRAFPSYHLIDRSMKTLAVTDDPRTDSSYSFQKTAPWAPRLSCDWPTLRCAIS